jgi:hypothetical protein
VKRTLYIPDTEWSAAMLAAGRIGSQENRIVSVSEVFRRALRTLPEAKAALPKELREQ